jgi:hypothetical protein
MGRKSGLCVAVAALALVVGTAEADAATAPARVTHTQSGATPAAPGQLDVAVRVSRFRAQGRELTARAEVTASLADYTGAVTTIKEPIALSAATSGGCKILNLVLDQLDLTLLGLNAHLDKVTLDITGDRNGGVLGVLFCRLSSALNKGKGAKAAAAAVNRHMARRPMRALRFRALFAPSATAAQAAPAPSCQVLNLIVGPLNLNLLGLIVDLNQVKLNITATPGGGALGDLFCSLSGGPQPST